MTARDWSTGLALAVSVAADTLCGGKAPNEVVCLCTHCYNDLDPLWEWSVHRAPDSASCLRCCATGRAADGLLFVVRPRTG